MGELWQQIAENLSFIGVSLAIIILLWGGAKLSQRWLPKMHRVTPAKRITIVAVCGAIATVLHMLDFPLLFLAPSFYKLDFSELPVLLCGFYLGPAAAVTCEALKIVLKLLLQGTSTAFVGDFANFTVGCSMVLPAVIIYHIYKTKKSAIAGLCVGTIILTVFGSAFNAIYLLPKFSQLYGLPLDAIIGMGTKIHPGITNIPTFVLLAVAPLNLIKGMAVSVLTILLYKKVAKPLFQLHK
jgi:riboflavin transporter FmnP